MVGRKRHELAQLRAPVRPGAASKGNALYAWNGPHMNQQCGVIHNICSCSCYYQKSDDKRKGARETRKTSLCQQGVRATKITTYDHHDNGDGDNGDDIYY